MEASLAACILAALLATAGQKTQSTLKGCVTSSVCKVGPTSVNYGNGMTTRTTFACCLGDACRTTTMTASPADTKPNGRSCHFCNSSLLHQCIERTIECAGAETQCVQAGVLGTSNFVQGCATESFCALSKIDSGIFGRLDPTTINCAAASGGAGPALGPAGLLLPALPGLLLLKFLS
nr:phospholipase A2 inhibitor and Ly6/PLAUR domain-containing protein-like [Caretta caretta]